MSVSPREFRTETWTLYAFGIVVIMLRLTARVRKQGFTNLQLEDWLTVNCILWYTLLVVSLNEIYFGGGSNFMTPEDEAALTPEIRAHRVVGSKWVLVSEEAMVLTVWTCKLCMLLLYRRLIRGLEQAKLINAAFIWVAAGFVGTQFGLFLNCRPFSEYWSVPTKNTQCWSYFNYQIIEAVFNISSDILVLVVAVPVFFRIQVPLLQRAIIVAIFSMGIFVVAAAILTKLYSLYPPLLTYLYLNWYCREASVCIYVTNLPVIWSLLLDVVPGLARFINGTRTSSSRSTLTFRRKFPSQSTGHNLQQFDHLGSTPLTPTRTSNQSQEHILEYGKIIQSLSITVERGLASDDKDLAKTTPAIPQEWKLPDAHSRSDHTPV